MGIIYSDPSAAWESAPFLAMSWTLRRANDLGFAMDVTVVSLTLQKPIKAGQFSPTGAAWVVVVKPENPTTGWELDVKFRTLNQPDFGELIDFLSNPYTLLLIDVHPRQWFVQPVGEIQENPLRAADTTGAGAPIGFVREIDVHFIEVERPVDAVD